MNIAIIGANGAIGSTIKRLLEPMSDVSLICVSRHGDKVGDVAFDRFLKEDLSNLDYLIDCSTCDLNDYRKLIKVISQCQYLKAFHFSSIRIKDSQDKYGIYKSDVLDIWSKSGMNNFEYVLGDLFYHDKKLLGYWDFVINPLSSFFVSHRKIKVYNIKKLICNFLFREDNNIVSFASKQLILPKSICQLLTILRCNKFFSRFFVVVM
jgi:hypothetical protein